MGEHFYPAWVILSLIIAAAIIAIPPLRPFNKWLYAAVHNLSHSIFSPLSLTGFKGVKLQGLPDGVREGQKVKPKELEDGKENKLWLFFGSVITFFAGYSLPIYISLTLIASIYAQNLILTCSVLLTLSLVLMLLGRNTAAIMYAITGIIGNIILLSLTGTAPELVLIITTVITTLLTYESLNNILIICLLQFDPDHTSEDDLSSLTTLYPKIPTKTWLVVFLITTITTTIFIAFAARAIILM